MTTYGHYYDEIFKIYCSKNIINKSKFLFFNMGTEVFMILTIFIVVAGMKL